MSADSGKPPISPFTVTISINGEDWGYITNKLRELHDMAFERFDAPKTFQSFGGGAGGSYSVVTVTRDILPEDFRKELDSWFMKQKQEGK